MLTKLLPLLKTALYFIFVWFISALILLIIFGVLDLTSGVWALIWFILPLFCSVLLVRKKIRRSANHNLHTEDCKVNTLLQETIPETESGEEKDTSINPAVADILQTLHQNTIEQLSRSIDEFAPAEQTESSATSAVKKTYRLAGTSFCLDNIMQLAIENPDYDMTKKEIIEADMTSERIWLYDFYPETVELVPEPENPHDKNAIKVLIDGLHVGYIKAGSCAHLLKIINESRIRSIECRISGGPYKIVTEEYDDEKDKDVYTLEKDECPYSVVLHIYEASTID